MKNTVNNKEDHPNLARKEIVLTKHRLKEEWEKRSRVQQITINLM